MVYPLGGKAALVTGGSRGIGAAIARKLAENGADVAITYASNHNAAEAVVTDLRARGRQALAINADNSNAGSVRGAVDEAAAMFGQLDILVNNAGVFDRQNLADASLDQFDHAISVNVRAAFVAAQAAIKHMREGGRIISIGSNLVDRVGRPNIGLYVMSKTALVGLTKAMARDFGQLGITANIVHPGPTDTDMNPASSERADQARSAMAIPRYGSTEDVASLVAWIASPESRYVTGSVFTVDGGTNA